MEDTYNEFIQNILNTRGRFSCGDEYHERHHIVPRCMDGGDEDENLIDLFAREHFIAHKLLAQENPNNDSLIYAWSCMAFPSNAEQDRYELTPEEYEEVRIALSETLSGRTLSKETRNKIGEKTKQRYQDREYLEKMKAIAKERYSVPENNPMFGKHHTEDTKEKIRESHQGKYDGEKNTMYGRTWWDENTPQEKIDEWIMHKSVASSGSNNPNYGKHWSQEIKHQLMCNNPNTKIVLQFDLCGYLLREYESIRQAERETGLMRKSISRCCNYKDTSCGGFFWMFKFEYEKYGKLIYKQDDRFAGEIIQCNDFGNIVATYSGPTEASKLTDIGLCAISKCLNKKSKHAGGYRWFYPKDYEDFIAQQNELENIIE